MLVIDGNLTSDEFYGLELKNKTFYLESGLQFLIQHKGYRPGDFHGFAGKASGGKSTLFRTLLTDIFHFNPSKKILVWLSEESSNEWKLDVGRPTKGISYSGLRIASEAEGDFLDKEPDEKLAIFIRTVLKEQPDIVYFDNLTTSKIYGENFNQQTKFTDSVLSLFREIKIPFVYFVHVNDKVAINGGEITQESLRGSKRILNVSSYFYIIQDFDTGVGRRDVLKLSKHRAHDLEYYLFGLVYDKDIRQIKGMFPMTKLEYQELKKSSRKFLRC